MKILRFIRYPATPMLIAAGVYTAVRVTPGDKTQVFAMLAFTAIGATEIVYGVVDVLNRSRSLANIGTHFLAGVGAMLVSYSLLNGLLPVLFTTGALLFSIGVLLLSQRTLQAGPSS